MRHMVLLLAVCALVAPAFGQDWEGDLLGITGNFHGSVGIAYDSKYIWRGFDVYDDVSATHILADLDLFETGFGLSLAGHRANSSGFEDRERWDYTVYYQNSLFAGEAYATQFRFGWVYYDYPELNTGESLNLQEGQLLLSWPSILPVKGLCPAYGLIKMWPAHSDSPLPDSASGWMHIFMLDYGFSIPGIVPDIPEHVIKLHSEIVYNDGVTITPARARSDWRVVYPNPDHDWSHVVFGASTDVKLIFNMVLTPAVYYQITLDNSINEDDYELWASIGLKYTF